MQTVSPEDVSDVACWFMRAIDYPQGDLPSAPPVLARWLADADALAAARDRVAYCGLFDIGRPEPPVPLLESHYHRDPAARLRRVVNFYRAYGVVQEANRAPDHLCVELSYLAFLARVAALYPLRADLLDALRAFARLHPGSFAVRCARLLSEHDGTGVYHALFEGLARFLADVGGDPRIALVPDARADALARSA